LLRKTVSGIMLTLFLTGMLTLAFNIQPVKAEGTIYIRADGTIDPPTANITTSDYVTYNFTNDNYGSIVVQRSNIIIDGSGYKLQGSGSGYGLNITIVNNVTMRNANIHGFQTGIYVKWSNYDVICGNNVTGNNQYGVYAWSALSINISRNNITGNNQIGIKVEEGSSGNITDNNITNGVQCHYRGHMNVYQNNIVGGVSELSAYADIYKNNITGGIGYRSGGEPGSFAGGCISQNNITGNIGLLGEGAEGDINENSIKGSVILNNMAWASISVNDIQGDITVAGHSVAIVFGNNVTTDYSGTGIYLDGAYCLHTKIFENYIRQNQIGISLMKSGNPYFDVGCSIYHNNFINNTQHVGTVTVSEVAWDDGYPSGGNYWSDYAGADGNGDGIGDTSYTIDMNNTDSYPLMSPYKGHDIAVEYIEINKTIVAQGTIQKIDVKVVNHGSFPQTFNLTVYANDTIIQTLLVYLAARARTTIRFYWETSAQPYGNYTITAYAWPVSDETDTADNTCLGSIVTVTIPGDVDGDFNVDLYDAVKLLTHYGAKTGQPAYDPVCDIDGNGNIDLYDAVELLTNYGQKYP
jgi:nitrous oxidase accessory protein NosD